VIWLLLLLLLYMAITSPTTLGEVIGLIGHLFGTVAASLTHFLGSSIKGS